MTKSFLDDNGIAYQDFDVGSDKEALQEMKAKSKQLGVPVIEIDGEILVGFDEAVLKEKLDLS